MVHVIHSVKMFRRELKAGDVFWHMVSLRGKPREIKGPCIIRGFHTNTPYRALQVVYVYQPAGNENEVIEEESVGDLVNEYHGAFLNEADAYQYFEIRRAAHASDPYFIARTMRHHEAKNLRAFFGNSI